MPTEYRSLILWMIRSFSPARKSLFSLGILFLDYFLLIAPLLVEGDRKELKDLEDGPENDLENAENLETDGLE